MKVSECKGKIKVGDWVRTNGSDGQTTKNFFEGEIVEINDEDFYVWQDFKNGDMGRLSPERYKYSWDIKFNNDEAEIEILKKFRESSLKSNLLNEKSMGLAKIAKRIFDPDTKKLVKADLLTSELDLTSEGKDELLAILFDDKKAELIKVAEEIIKERQENKECC